MTKQEIKARADRRHTEKLIKRLSAFKHKEITKRVVMAQRLLTEAQTIAEEHASDMHSMDYGKLDKPVMKVSPRFWDAADVLEEVADAIEEVTENMDNWLWDRKIDPMLSAFARLRGGK